MTCKQLKGYCLQLLFKSALMRSSLVEEEGRLNKYDSSDITIAKSIISYYQNPKDRIMIVEELETQR